MTDSARPLAVVLDTNAALALWLFRDARLVDLDAALRDGTLIWLSTQPMRDELTHEIRADRCLRHAIDAQAVRSTVTSVPTRWCAPPPPTTQASLRCRDGDDQMFIDLALAEGARWLFTRDKALLKLRGRAQSLGLDILVPEAWPGAR
jgi:predicted nucleic acid-binding protein